MEKLLQLAGVRKTFRDGFVLEDVNLDLVPSEVHMVVGENGSGKSSIMKLIAGVYGFDGGSMRYLGTETRFSGIPDAQARGVMYRPQELQLFDNLSVAENLFFDHLPRTRWGAIDELRLQDDGARLLRDLQIRIDPRAGVGTLGYAQRHLLEAAKSCVGNWKVVAFDEPTAALTEAETEVLFRIIGTLKAKGLGILYISHRMAEIYRIADEVTILRDGQWIDTKDVSAIDQVALVNRMVGRDLREIYPEKNPASASAPVTLEVRGLSLEGVFSDVSFSLRAGEILGFAGLVGSGRTDVARTICGLYGKSAGSVWLNGEEAVFRNYRESIKKGIVYLTENRALEGLFLELGVAQNISVMDLDKVARMSLIRSRDERALASRYVERMQIKLADVSQKANSLSGGNQQKVLIAKLLSVSPKVVIMDEPTRGIDIGAKAQIYHLLRRLASEGIGVIMISSELPEVIGVCDRVAVMFEGSLCAVLEGGDVNEQSIIQKACLSEQGEA